MLLQISHRVYACHFKSLRVSDTSLWTYKYLKNARYTADWASQCREQAADRHPPGVYGFGAAVVDFHPPGTCCSKRPSLSHGWSRRPWSDFLRGYLTFRLGLAASAAAGGDAVSGGPLPDPLWISVHASASTGPGRARDHYASSEKVFDQARQKLIQRFFQMVNQNERSLLSGMLPVCCYGLRACLCVWTRERASDALPRISAGPMLPSWTTGNLDSRPWQ